MAALRGWVEWVGVRVEAWAGEEVGRGLAAEGRTWEVEGVDATPCGGRSKQRKKELGCS